MRRPDSANASTSDTPNLQRQDETMTDTVTLGCFYRSLPMMAATENGFFEEHGITVDFQQVSSSIQQFQYLSDERYDIVQTSPDNSANYRFNDANPIDQPVDNQGFLGLDYGMYLVMVGRPGIERLEDLRGGVVSVDAPDSGFAYVAYRILERAGLRRGEDYSIVNTGGVYDRYQAFMGDGDFDATLLSGGFETRAAEAGYVLLDSVLDIADPYLGVWAAARSTWLQEQADTAAGFVSGYLEGTRWVFDSANREGCLDLLATLPGTSRELAEKLYDVQLRPGVGNVPDGSIDPRAVRNVLSLREEFGGFERDLDIDAVAQPGELYDLGFLERATS
jgi:ABC-type nitrate/sulfonate/bicarbonate transport system substrate-binding protein